MMTIGVRKSNLEQKLRIGAVGLQSEMLKISDIKNIQNPMKKTLKNHRLNEGNRLQLYCKVETDRE